MLVAPAVTVPSLSSARLKSYPAETWATFFSGRNVGFGVGVAAPATTVPSDLRARLWSPPARWRHSGETLGAVAWPSELSPNHDGAI